MGMYLNPGGGMFQISLDSEIYVDKSELIAQTNKVFKTQERYICASRPRRFGKSMALNMLAAYYDRTWDAHQQFAGLAIEQDPSFEKHLNQYDVIRLIMTDFLEYSAGDVKQMIELIESSIKFELSEAHPEAAALEQLPLAMCLSRIYASSHTPFVFLVDEWDCIMREAEIDASAQKRYLDWLRTLLKDKEYIGLAYTTGILPVKKYGAHSALNMFTEISIIDARNFASYTGFTDDEVEGLCARYDMDFDECQRWYDGYDVDGIATYNPRSVVMSMTGHRFGNYWTQTESFEALQRYIMLDMDGLRESVVELVGGAHVPVDVTAFQNDMTTFATADDVLTLLVHLGYLTYSRAHGTVRIPNSEVADQFRSTLRMDSGWQTVVDAIEESDELMAATLAGDAARVAELVERAHEQNASVLRYNDENSLACVLSIAYWSARRTHVIEREAPAGKGYADLIFRPRPSSNAPALVVELKRDDTAENAIAQIREKNYATALTEFKDTLLVGIAYDSSNASPDHKSHICAIERI